MNSFKNAKMTNKVDNFILQLVGALFLIILFL
jgi:hypothetical protein